MATMQVVSFHVFRQHTEGASAIQSRHYKMVEALCRRPSPDRLHSAAYRSAPEVRDLVLAGQPSLSQTLDAIGERLSDTEVNRMDQAMAAFAAALLRWRQTHYRLAVRMLGDRPGTGATEGTAYLRSTRAIPVFHEPAGNRPNSGTARRHRAAHQPSAACLIAEGG
jgi:tryptophan 2,3-dioxygenase